MVLSILCGALMFGAARADERLVRLAVPPDLVETGLLEFILPRFTLKHQVRVELVAPGAPAELSLSPQPGGTPVFSGPRATWHLQHIGGDHAGAQRLAEWLASEIGQRTVTSYQVDGTAPFTLPQAVTAVAVTLGFTGDAALGKTLSLKHCGRCHVVAEENRMKAIGSTPSFPVLRSLPDWDRRFESFFALNPHPAFTQVKDVTPPFAEDRPPPIFPLEMTLDDLEAILAYVDALPPADLGAPLQHQ